MGARRSNDEVRELRVRVTELEARVGWLERRLKKVAVAAKVKPEPPKKGPQRPRCPGCFAEVPKGRRDRTCVYCGFEFDVVPPLRGAQLRSRNR
ncbi:MAG: hypothetical protein ACOZQL_06835 [Myxococcota bacterium]